MTFLCDDIYDSVTQTKRCFFCWYDYAPTSDLAGPRPLSDYCGGGTGVRYSLRQVIAVPLRGKLPVTFYFPGGWQ